MAQQWPDLDCNRALRRLVAAHQDPPKWVFEKTWDLNASRSKRLTVGFCLARRLDICITLESPAGLGVKLSVQELQHLLSPKMRVAVFEHLQERKAVGALHTKVGDMVYQCVLLRNGEPGLRLSKDNAFVILGEVTCTTLYYAGPHILQRVALLDNIGLGGAKWVVRILEEVRSEVHAMGYNVLSREKDVYPVLTALSGKLGARRLEPTTLDVEFEMFCDMLFKHKELLARMYVDFVQVGDDDGADANEAKDRA